MRHSVPSRCDEHVMLTPSVAPPSKNEGGGASGADRSEHNFVPLGPSLSSLASLLVKRAIVSRGESQSGAIFADLPPTLALPLLRETSSHLSVSQLTHIEAALLARTASCQPGPEAESRVENGADFGEREGSSVENDPLAQALGNALEQGWEEQVRRLRGQTRGCPERGPREGVRAYYGRLAEYQKRRLADIGERLRDAYGREEAAVRTSKLIGPVKSTESVRHRVSASSALMKKSRQEALLSRRGAGAGTSGSTGAAPSGPASGSRTVGRTGARTGSAAAPMGILLPPKRK